MFTNGRDLESRIGKTRFKQLLDHDHDGFADADVVAVVCTDANREIESLLAGKGFSHDQMVLLANDETLRRQAAWVAAEYAILMKPELLAPDGTSMYSKLADAARAIIRTIANGDRKLATDTRPEPTSEVKKYVFEPDPPFHVAPSIANKKGQGGF